MKIEIWIKVVKDSTMETSNHDTGGSCEDECTAPQFIDFSNQLFRSLQSLVINDLNIPAPQELSDLK